MPGPPSAGPQCSYLICVRRNMVIEPAPSRLKFVEQGDEDFCARPMHVGVGHGHGILLDRDDHNMGIGGPDIVLNQ
jgi:hypothetical protein